MLDMDKLVALCSNRGFIYPSSDIYGGLNGFWDYGPLGVEMRNNVKAAWWQTMVRERRDVVGLDSSIIANPETWVASGHVENFHDPMVDCRECKRRFRADQLAGETCPEHEGRAISDCELTEPRQFNLMLRTEIGATADSASIAYLRAETCQSIFLDFRRVMQSARRKPPFGIAQIGKAFRNEINPRNFIFRSREFEQMECEFFCEPSSAMEWFERFREIRWRWHLGLGIPEASLRWHEHGADERAHYAQAAYDIEFEFPFGWSEFEGIHHRGDHDLSAHTRHSGKDLSYTEAETQVRYTPYVIETSVGVDRCMLVLLCAAFGSDEVGGQKRQVLHLDPRIAPHKAALLPLSKKLAEPASGLLSDLQRRFEVDWDASGSIGRRYRRQDEIGTPWCITWDFQTAEDHKVTIRDRDSLEQVRIANDQVASWLQDRLLERA